MDAKHPLFHPNRMTRRRFMHSVGAVAAATAAFAGGVARPAAQRGGRNVIPADRFGRMFPTLPPFASHTKKMEDALMELG